MQLAATPHLGDESGDQAGVDAAGQVRADRHVRYERVTHRPFQRLGDESDRFFGRAVAHEPLSGQLPVRRLGDPAGARDREPVAGQHLPHALDQRVRRRHRPVGEVVVQRRVIHAPVADQRDQRLDLGGEREDLGVGVVVQRQDAHPVPHQVQVTGLRVVDRVRELTAQLPHAVDAVPLVQREQRLGVAVGVERVGQLLAQLAVVEDLAVERDVPLRVRRGHRLLGRGEVDDRQPRVREPGRAADPDPGVVGTAVVQRGRHGPQQRRVDRFAVETPDSGDAAHQASPSARRIRSRARASHEADSTERRRCSGVPMPPSFNVRRICSRKSSAPDATRTRSV